MNCHPGRWLWGLIPVAMLTWVAVQLERSAIETDLETRSAAALEAAGHEWAVVAFDGRDGLLAGHPDQLAQRDEAVAVVSGVWGVRVVRTQLDAAEPSDTSPPLGTSTSPQPPVDQRPDVRPSASPAADAIAGIPFSRATSVPAPASSPGDLAPEAVGPLAPSASADLHLSRPHVDAPLAPAESVQARDDHAAAVTPDSQASAVSPPMSASDAKPAEPESPAMVPAADAPVPPATPDAPSEVSPSPPVVERTAEQPFRMPAADAQGTASSDAKPPAEPLAETPAAQNPEPTVAALKRTAEEPFRMPAADAQGTPASDAKPAAEPLTVTPETENSETLPLPDAAPAALDQPILPTPKPEQPTADPTPLPPQNTEDAKLSSSPVYTAPAVRRFDTAALPPGNNANASPCLDQVRGAAQRVEVHFGRGAARLDEAGKALIDGLVGTLNICPEATLRIAGHADASGRARHNQVLSRHRARGVASYLTDKGIDAGRLVAVGYGDKQPVAPNDSQANRARNRRIELIVTARTAPLPPMPVRKQGTRNGLSDR
jgi:outer membrane protein OmpA-like peptidoglycan-associated protein